MGRRLACHTYCILQRYLGLRYHCADKAVAGSDGACKSTAVCQLANAVFDDNPVIECFRIRASCCNSQCVGDECHTFHALNLIRHTENGGRYMNAVGYTFDGHIVDEIDTLDCAFVLVAHLVVEARHGVVEVRDVGEACCKSGLHVVVFCIGVCYAWQYAFLCAIASELQGSGKLRGSIPACQAIRMLHNGDVFVGVRVLNPTGLLCSSLVGAKVVSFEVKAEDGRILLLHQFGTGLYGLFNHGHGTAGQGGEDACRSVLCMSFNGCTESLWCAFLEVSASSSVDVHIDEARHYIHAFGINEFCADDGEVAVRYFQYLAVPKDDAAVLEPSLWRQDFCIDDLC